MNRLKSFRHCWLVQIASLAFVLSVVGMVGCARVETAPPLRGTAVVTMDPDRPLADARRNAILRAERRARNALFSQAVSLIGAECIVADPLLGAELDDAVRAAQIVERTIEGDTVTLTVEMPREDWENRINAVD